MPVMSLRRGEAPLTESPHSITATLTEEDLLRAAGVSGSTQRLTLPKVVQADTRPLPPIRTEPLGRLPRVASWRDVLELGSSSSTRLRELGETCLLFGRASANRSVSRAKSFCRPVSLPGALAELGAAQLAKATAGRGFHPRAGLYAAHEALLDLWIRQTERSRGAQV